MSDLLAIGGSGVRAYQTALNTVSDNIANANTAGYVRRQAVLRESNVGTGDAASPDVLGFGVTATSLARSADDLKSQTVRDASTDLARTTTSVQWLDQIETAFDSNQLGTSLTSFFNSAKTISADPTATTPRAAFLESAKSIAGAFLRTGKAIDTIGANLDATAQSAVTSITDLAATLAQINDGLARTASDSTASLQLLDRRDQTLEQLSTFADISVKTDTLGRVTVNLGGVGGPALVAGLNSAAVSYQRNGDVVAFTVSIDNSVSSYSPAGGVLAGIVEGAQRITAARTELNRIANGFTSAVNSVQTGGDDLDGLPGQPLFATGATPTDISVTLTDPRGVAAAATGAGARDNANLDALETARTNGKFEADTTAFITANATALAARKSVADAQTAIHDSAVAQRDALSGVNLNAEAVDLLRFQQAYQASSRVIQTARDIFQTLIDAVG